MSRMLKKVLCLLVAVVMLITMTTACGGEKPAEKETTAAGTTQAAATEDPNKPYEPADSMKLKVWWSHSTDLTPDEAPKGEKNVVQNWLTQKSKVTIDTGDIIGNGGQNWLGKLTVMVAGGSLPDIAVTGGGGATEIITKLLEGDKVWELTPELLQKYAPNIWKKTNEYMWSKVKTSDGKIYAIPFLFSVSKDVDPNIDERYLYGQGVPGTNTGSSWDGYGIRDDISKKLFSESKSFDELQEYVKSKGDKCSNEDVLDLPIKTKEDMIKLFYDIKDLNLKEGSKPVYAMGIPAGDSWMLFSQLMPNFMGNWGHFQMSYFDLNTETMKFGMLESKYKEFAQILNKMVRDRVAEPESLVQTPAQYTEKVLAGRYAVVHFGRAGKGIDDLNKMLKDAGKTYKYRPLVSQVPVAADEAPYKAPPGFGGTISILKSDLVKSEAELAQILHYYDLQYTEEFSEIFCWGPKEAGLYTENADGTRTFKEEKLNKALLQGVGDAAAKEELMGLGQRDPYRQVFQYGRFSVYDYSIVNKTFVANIANAVGRVLPGSPYEIKKVGPAQNPWDGEFAAVKGVPEMLNGWQESYDNAFKATLASKNDEEFEKKWSEAVKKLDTLGITGALPQMTEIAKEQYARMKDLNK